MQNQESSETGQREDQELLEQLIREKNKKIEHQKFLIKVMLNGLGLSQEEKRAFLIDVMKDLNLIDIKVIKEVRR